MPRFFVNRPLLMASWAVLALSFASALPAQLVREDTPRPSTKAQAASPPQAAPATHGKIRLSQDVALTGDSHWVDTKIDILPGERVVITAAGTLRYQDAKSDNGPEGLARGFMDLLRVLSFSNSGRGALIGRIGDADTTQPFLVGAKYDSVSPLGGRLALGINQAENDSADGSYSVHIEVYAPDSSAPSSAFFVAKKVDSLPGINNRLFAKIPRRVSDKDGHPGDMVNFLILGSEDSMQRVFTTAGWVKVDPDVTQTLLRGILDSVSKEAYLTMPMSQLYLFGRPQDYGWAHAEPISVVRSRNHLRIWKAPFTVNGETLWVGAATHDIGFERDQRNNKVTHKIDPDIDLERDYVEKTLTSTGLVTEVSHFLPENPVQDARTATGGGFHSNGQVLILKLAENAKGSSSEQTNK
jgi:hypothetical protein